MGVAAEAADAKVQQVPTVEEGPEEGPEESHLLNSLPLRLHLQSQSLLALTELVGPQYLQTQPEETLASLVLPPLSEHFVVRVAVVVGQPEVR